MILAIAAVEMPDSLILLYLNLNLPSTTERGCSAVRPSHGWTNFEFSNHCCKKLIYLPLLNCYLDAKFPRSEDMLCHKCVLYFIYIKHFLNLSSTAERGCSVVRPSHGWTNFDSSNHYSRNAGVTDSVISQSKSTFHC